MAAVQKHFGTFQTLGLSGNFCMAGPGKLPIFCETKHLKHFQTTDQIHPTVQWPFLSAETLDSKWASSTLKVRRCQSPVSRTEDHMYPPEIEGFWKGQPPSLQECRHIERCLFRQLAKQIELQELHVGTLEDIDSPSRIRWYSLDMTPQIKKWKEPTAHAGSTFKRCTRSNGRYCNRLSENKAVLYICTVPFHRRCFMNLL